MCDVPFHLELPVRAYDCRCLRIVPWGVAADRRVFDLMRMPIRPRCRQQLRCGHGDSMTNGTCLDAVMKWGAAACSLRDKRAEAMRFRVEWRAGKQRERATKPAGYR